MNTNYLIVNLYSSVNKFQPMKRDTIEDMLEQLGKKIGIKNLKFGNVITDIEAKEKTCVIISNNPYTIKINGKRYKISIGTNKFEI